MNFIENKDALLVASEETGHKSKQRYLCVRVLST